VAYAAFIGGCRRQPPAVAALGSRLQRPPVYEADCGGPL